IATTMYWNANQDVAGNHKMVERGLKLVPESEIIKSGWYDKGYVKYATGSQTTPSTKKTDSKTPKTGRTIRVVSKDKTERVYKF
ncbi:MAG: hypothetical protein NTY32_02220, partial [Bacteroidia bacterium]|nr:hypothetical protein [Bacteroidia bacterium]